VDWVWLEIGDVAFLDWQPGIDGSSGSRLNGNG